MRMGEVLFSAVRGLLANKLRSILTTLGILIGVASVIVIVAVGQGASNMIMNSINSLGAHTLSVYQRYSEAGPGRPLTLDDAEALAAPELADRIKAVVPGVWTSGSVNDGVRTKDQAQVLGTHPDYFQLNNALLAKGTYFSKADVTESRKVIVMGGKLAKELFNGADPVNRQVIISGMQFVVVGVLEEAGEGGRGRSTDEMLAMPLSTLQNTLTGPQQPLSQFMVQAQSVEKMDAARAAINQVLRAKHRIDADKPPDFEVSDPRELTRSSRQIDTVLTYLILAIGGIALLIGGVGITNIMLVTVTERTREIGIRKAIGATRGAIMGQFLAEATMLSMFGGFLGVVVGVIAGQFSIRGLQLTVVPGSVLLAFGVSALIGLFFGALPANRASKLHPIQALRHE
ncbi:ABC transporter permease [Crossiella cryophila]|uniref:Putative ABC transport system permease protein n=1 Tax=Crossiella cryophila TaxID=43355 RepID=A0A7W7C4M8_9PSEU|nr:ABC transporter permease [Crossiella cryophila]MBB4674473.1 putative ABC transport system permease protein [Crossiella cryophila]